MTSNEERCPACSAHVTPGADWCTLCFADLRVAPVAPLPMVTEGEAAPDLALAVEQPLVPEQVAEPAVDGRGKHARAATTYGDPAPLDAADLTALQARADEMLAILAAESGHPMGPLADRLESTTSRVVAGLIGLVALSAVGLLVMTVLGHFI
jgi:hypothetical protein